MQIIIDMNTVWLDDEANDFLNTLKSSMPYEEVESWLENWLTTTIVPTLMASGPETTATIN